MSIGKEIYALRKQKGLAREEPADRLRKSRRLTGKMRAWSPAFRRRRTRRRNII